MPGRRRHDALRELGLFGLAYLVYFGVRAITEGTAATAVENAVELVRLEQRLGIAWEQAVQDAVVASGTLLDAANAVYIYGHWPVIVVGGVLLFRYRRRHYYHLRNAALLSGLAGAGPVAMVFAVIATANHFVVDVVAGVAIVLAGLLVLRLARRRQARRTLVRAYAYERDGAVHRRPPCGQRPRAPARRRGAAAPSRRG